MDRLKENNELVMKKFIKFNSNELKMKGRELEVVEYDSRPMICLKNQAQIVMYFCWFVKADFRKTENIKI